MLIIAGNNNIYAEKAIRGTLDLSALSSLNTVRIGGEWAFYKNVTYNETLSGQVLPVFSNVPGSWNNENKGADGYGTFKVKIILPKNHEDRLMLRTFAIATASNIYLNGKLLLNNGHFSVNKKEAQPDFVPRNIVFVAENDTVELAIEVCNYHYRQGGIWITPELGNFTTLNTTKNKNQVLLSGIIGSLFIISIYFLGFYITKRNSKVFLYFSALSFSSAIRLGSNGEILFKTLWPEMPWELLVKAELISLYAIVGFSGLLIGEIIPKYSNKRIISFSAYANLIMGLTILFLTVRLGSYTVPSYLVFAGIILTYYSYCVVRQLVFYFKDFWLSALGFFALSIGGLNDILYSQEFIQTGYLLPIGVFIFGLFQAISISRTFSLSFTRIEVLSEQLRKSNQDQEAIIQKRTHQLENQKQELAQIIHVKDKIFSIVAHDMRAPLKSLLTVLEFANDDDITLEELRGYLKGIRKNVSGLNLMLENLLNWSQNQLNNKEVKPELFDARTTIQEVVSFYDLTAKEKKINLVNKVQDRASVYVDKNHLNLILRNLVSNAIKFTDADGSITLSALHTDNEQLMIMVADNGVGMTQEQLDKLFKEDEHTSTYGTQNERGTGLGLLLCKEYAELNKGGIKVESKQGEGTTISIMLPVKSF